MRPIFSTCILLTLLLVGCGDDGSTGGTGGSDNTGGAGGSETDGGLSNGDPFEELDVRSFIVGAEFSYELPDWVRGNVRASSVDGEVLSVSLVDQGQLALEIAARAAGETAISLHAEDGEILGFVQLTVVARGRYEITPGGFNYYMPEAGRVSSEALGADEAVLVTNRNITWNTRMFAQGDDGAYGYPLQVTYPQQVVCEPNPCGEILGVPKIVDPGTVTIRARGPLGQAYEASAEAVDAADVVDLEVIVDNLRCDDGFLSPGPRIGAFGIDGKGRRVLGINPTFVWNGETLDNSSGSGAWNRERPNNDAATLVVSYQDVTKTVSVPAVSGSCQ